METEDNVIGELLKEISGLIQSILKPSSVGPPSSKPPAKIPISLKNW